MKITATTMANSVAGDSLIKFGSGLLGWFMAEQKEWQGSKRANAP